MQQHTVCLELRHFVVVPICLRISFMLYTRHARSAVRCDGFLCQIACCTSVPLSFSFFFFFFNFGVILLLHPFFLPSFIPAAFTLNQSLISHIIADAPVGNVVTPCFFYLSSVSLFSFSLLFSFCPSLFSLSCLVFFFLYFFFV